MFFRAWVALPGGGGLRQRVQRKIMLTLTRAERFVRNSRKGGAAATRGGGVRLLHTRLGDTATNTTTEVAVFV